MVPSTSSALERVQREDLGFVDTLARYYDRQIQWFRRDPFVLFLPETGNNESFGRPIVYRLEKGVVTEIIEARSLTYQADGWHLRDAVFHEVATAKREEFEDYPIALQARLDHLAAVAG